MLYKNISLMNGATSITFSNDTINFSNITAPEYRITSSFPITGYTINSKSFSLGTNSTTILSCNTFINLEYQGISANKLTCQDVSLSDSNINIGEFRYIGPEDDPFIISGTVSSLTTNTIVLTKTTNIYTPTISGAINTKALTLNSSKTSTINSLTISNTNDYTITGIQSAIIKINVSIGGDTYWEHITYAVPFSNYTFYQGSLEHKFWITISPNGITYNHNNTPPSNTVFTVYKLASITFSN